MIESQKLFSKSISSNSPGIFFSSVNVIMSYINRIFSTMDLPFIKPVCSLFIMSSNTVLILLAIVPGASLYTVSRRVNGLQFF